MAKTPPATVPRHADGRWPEGQSGNPGGRKPGIKERFPRGFVKSLVLGVIQGNRALIERALARAAKNPRHVVTVLDHAAKLNRELGLGSDGSSGVTVIKLVTNLHPEKLRRRSG